MRRAALRPFVPTPVLVPPGSPGLPNRDADSYAPPLDLRRVRSEDRRARAEGPSEGRVLVKRMHDFSCLRRVHTLCGACLTSFPSSASFKHPLSSARRHFGRYPTQPTDRPRLALRRHPAKGAAVQQTRMLSTATTREGLRCLRSRKDCSLRPSRRLSRSRRPAFLVRLRTRCFLIGHCKFTVRSPAGP